ncbi:hypothetical protein I3760_05G136000 [Carya illinoinensis]|nr:hypothetical protein I3760_05G136000 [Carya illinoinensis]
MKSYHSFFVELLVLQCLALASASLGYNFHYFVQQWPGSHSCVTRKSCHPTTGKPATNFSISGFRPYYKDGSSETFCNVSNINRPFDLSKISDLTSKMQANWPSLACPCSDSTTGLWLHEWYKYGTCSESRYLPGEHAYFKAALDLKDRVNILQILEKSGIQPNGGFYNLSSIHSAIHKAIGYDPWIKCKTDASGNSQLYQIYLCVGRYELTFTECPVLPRTTEDCASAIKFPAF